MNRPADPAVSAERVNLVKRDVDVAQRLQKSTRARVCATSACTSSRFWDLTTCSWGALHFPIVLLVLTPGVVLFSLELCLGSLASAMSLSDKPVPKELAPFATRLRSSLPSRISSLQCIAAALADVHAAGYAHNDLHCGNVLVASSDGALKLADLEFAVTLSQKDGQVSGHASWQSVAAVAGGAVANSASE